jgi:hypothetical protein
MTVGNKQFIFIYVMKIVVDLITANYEGEKIKAFWYPHAVSFEVHNIDAKQARSICRLTFTLLDNGNIKAECKTSSQESPLSAFHETKVSVEL